MKNKIFLLSLLFIIATTLNAVAQWPGNFYAFILKDAEGNIIDSASNNYKMIAISNNGVEINIKSCADKITWRFYEGGNHYMGSTQKLIIEKLLNGKTSEVMTIVFPPSISGGKEKYYRNLFVGNLKFKSGTYKIRLPATDKQWDEIKEIKVCEDGHDYDSNFFDISEYQNK